MMKILTLVKTKRARLLASPHIRDKIPDLSLGQNPEIYEKQMSVLSLKDIMSSKVRSMDLLFETLELPVKKTKKV